MKTKFSGKVINTLAQSGTDKVKKKKVKPPKTVWGKGTDGTNTERMQRRAERKMKTYKLMPALADVARARDEQERETAYWNTYHCQRRVIESNNRLYGDYCKNRFCPICSAIRKADIIKRYMPVITTWKQPYFVTLTAKAVKAGALKERIYRMLRSFDKMIACCKKRYQRGTGIKLVGIKSIECNFNPITQTYNPHFHLMVESREAAEIIVKEWLKRCGKKHANPKAQDIQPVYDKEKALVEIVKYSTKVITDPTMQKRRKMIDGKIYVKALHNIIGSMEGHRVFDRFGFNLPKKEKVVIKNEVTNYNELIFSSVYFDWVNRETKDYLTGYEADSKLLDTFEDIDKDLE